MNNLSTKLLLHTFFRTFLVGAAYNKRGLQNVGFMYVMEPGLAAIWKNPQDYKLAVCRYVRYHNCHLFWTPLLAGMFLRIELDITQNRMTDVGFMALKDTVTNTLSAIGDSVFGGTTLVTWGLGCALFFALNLPLAAVALTALLFCALMIFKAITFAVGLRHGIYALPWLHKWNLINWGERLKIVNALLLLGILALLVPKEAMPVLWVGTIIATSFAAWLVNMHVPRPILALLATLGVLFFV